MEDKPGGEMPTNQRSIRGGGLMRCCTGTYAENTDPSKVGDNLPCRWCSSSMRVAPDGVWEWNHD